MTSVINTALSSWDDITRSFASCHRAILFLPRQNLESPLVKLKGLSAWQGTRWDMGYCVCPTSAELYAQSRDRRWNTGRWNKTLWSGWQKWCLGKNSVPRSSIFAPRSCILSFIMSNFQDMLDLWFKKHYTKITFNSLQKNPAPHKGYEYEQSHFFCK